MLTIITITEIREDDGRPDTDAWTLKSDPDTVDVDVARLLTAMAKTISASVGEPTLADWELVRSHMQ